MANRLALIFAPDTVRTATRVALIVGLILNFINQGDRMLAGEWASVNWFKFVLTFFVPFGVSTYSSFMAKMRFVPGVRAAFSTRVRCKRCGSEADVEAGTVVPACPTCGSDARWKMA